VTAGRIVVVSENPRAAAALAAVVRRKGYDVFTADHWDDAARLLTSIAPDILLADLTDASLVPDDLFDVRRALRVRLIVISPSRQARKLEADACIPAPVREPDLFAVLEQLNPQPTISLVITRERRALTRPRPGDVRPCPRCGFAMRFEVPPEAPPAWLCRNLDCLNAEFVRGTGSDPERVAPPSERP
jgi:CheY-like chemotaxis protein